MPVADEEAGGELSKESAPVITPPDRVKYLVFK
jgi:hypothetical protein